MQDRNFEPPYTHSSSLVINYLETIMRLSYDHPTFMKYFNFFVGGLSAKLLLSPSEYIPTPLAVGGLLFSTTTALLQHQIFGMPVNHAVPVYQKGEMNYGTATAKLSIEDKHMPLLKIEAKKYYDAGFVEGYMLAKAMQVNMKQMNRLFEPLFPILGVPSDDQALMISLEEVLKTIPEKYQDEMQGKVAGYNEWLKMHDSTAKPLSFARYLLMQLLPDFRNYNPFAAKKIDAELPSMACTTIAMRVGDYTLFTRVLDWLSYGMAGKYFLQVDRHIAGGNRTIDMTHPLTSGALTVVNDSHLLIEINVSNGDKMEKAEGMPSLFFNRYCAEEASSVDEVQKIATHEKPLVAYHMTTTDGVKTASIHFQQDEDVQGEDAIETLNEDKSSPQLLVVANQGVKFVDGDPILTNHRDSFERKENVNAFFEKKLKPELQSFIDKQEKELLSAKDIQRLEEICVQIARLALLNNCESVFCGLYVYYKNRLIDARVATDNLYAPSQEWHQFKKLNV